MANDIIARIRLNGQKFAEDSKATFSAFNRDAIASADQAKKHFQSSFNEINAIAQRALQMPRTAGGSLDLDVGAVRAQAAAARDQATALREIATASERAATGAGDYSQATRLSLAAAQAAATEADDHAKALLREADALERLQIELNKTRSSTLDVDEATKKYGNSLAAQRFAAQSLGQQASDFAVQVLSGQSAMVAFAQQAPQAGLALAGFEGKLGKVGAFLTGPWGIALTIGISALGILGPKLLDAGNAADEMEKRLSSLAKEADSFGDAQSLLAKVIDLTTGKLKTQNEVLIEAVRLQALAAKTAAKMHEPDLRDAAANAGIPSIIDKVAGVYAGMGRVSGPQDNEAVQDIGRRFTTGKIDITAARKELEALNSAGKLAEKAMTGVMEKFIKFASVQNDAKAAQEVLDALDGKGIAADLKPYKAPGKPKSTEARDEFGRDAADRIANLASGFVDMPTQSERVRKALVQLDDLVDDIQHKLAKKPELVSSLLADADAARKVIESGLTKPFDEYVREQRESLAVQKLVSEGRFVEADALRDALSLQREMGPLGEKHLATVTALAAQRKQVARAMEDERRQIALYTSAVGDAQRTFEQFIAGLQSGQSGTAFKNLGKNLLDGFRALDSRILSEKLFGGLDREIEDLITGETGVEAGGKYLADQAVNLGDTLKDLAGTIASVNDNWKISGGATGAVDAMIKEGFVSDSYSLAGDNPDIIVSASREVARSTKELVSSTKIYNMIGNKFVDRIGALGIKLPAGIEKALRENLGDALQGAATGVAAGKLGTDILGTRNSGLGGALGGAAGKKLGGMAGEAISKAIGGKLGETLGSFGGPLGSVIGGVAGSAILGAFKKVKWGSSTISLGDGQLTAGDTSGNSKAAQKAASASADSIVSSVDRILDQLGGSLISASNITVGQRHGDYRVNVSGTSLKKKKGAVDFDDDQQAAVQYAIQQILGTAVIDGLSAASVRILKSGQDLEDSVTKAGLIEAIPQRLLAMLDPVAAAVDDLNKKWVKTVAALREGGASTDQMAEAQRLYGLELAQVKQTTRGASADLKDFLSGFSAGSGSRLSLREQETAAKAALDPYLSKIAGGATIDQDAYQKAASTFLDIERQLYGSTEKYFAAQSLVMQSTAAAIQAIDNAVPIGGSTADPFAEKTASATKAIADMTEQTNDLLTEIRNLLAQGGSTGSTFIDGAIRSFG